MITQNEHFKNYKNLITDFIENTKYLTNHTITQVVDNYFNLCENVSITTKELALQLMRYMIKEIDCKFRDDKERLNRYYVKDFRPRTIMTPFGELTFYRTIYQSKQSNECYTHVDRHLGLAKYDRYDPAVKAMIVELYANQNSMIKVGEIIGDRIYSNFTLDEARFYNAVPRQTIFNVVSQMKIYKPTLSKAKRTPKTLYIAADEHFVHLQRSKKNSAMVKAGIIFDDFKNTQSGHGRNEYLGKHHHFSLSEYFWEEIYQAVIEKYDINKIKNIYIMGDGAGWIKKGVKMFKRGQATFVIDRYHFKAAVIKLTSDSDERRLLLSYIDSFDLDSFRTLANKILKDETTNISLKTRQNNVRYILNHWEEYRIMDEKVIIGCGMEGLVSHTLASNFSSVPKAYVKDNLEVYIQSRALLLNGRDLREVFMNTFEKEDTVVTDDKPLNWSIFESRETEEQSTLSRYVRGTIAKN